MKMTNPVCWPKKTLATDLTSLVDTEEIPVVEEDATMTVPATTTEEEGTDTSLANPTMLFL